MGKTLRKPGFSIEKAIISIKKPNISIEKLNISIEKTNISIKKPHFYGMGRKNYGAKITKPCKFCLRRNDELNSPAILYERQEKVRTGPITDRGSRLTFYYSVTIVVTVMAANSQFSMAVHVLTMLARSGDENVKSDCIAASVNTNAVVIRRLLSQLNQAKLVLSQTGSSGGTRLSRCPSEINLAEVYKAVCCGEVFALHAKSPNQDCPVGKNIAAVLCHLQKEIDRTVGEKLSQYSLKDFIEKVEHGQV